jgi:hypothetical protein
MPILVMRVSRDPRLTSHDLGATAGQGAVCWRPGSPILTRPSTSGPFLSMSGHTGDITPLLGISSARWPSSKLPILQQPSNNQAINQTINYVHRCGRIAPKTQWEKTGSSKPAPGLKNSPTPLAQGEKAHKGTTKRTNNPTINNQTTNDQTTN